MRRKHVLLLANAARLLLLGICCAAGGTAAIWRWRPEWVDGFEAQLVQQHVRAPFDRLAELDKETDPARREAGYRVLLAELEHVRRQDRVADVVTGCYERLSQIAEGKGDLQAALDWTNEQTTFESGDGLSPARRADLECRNVISAARRGDLECRIDGLRDEGIKDLRALNKKYPGHPIVGRTLVAGLLRADKVADAAAVLDAEIAAVRSNLWTISWDAGAGLDRMSRRVELMPVAEGKEMTFRFRVAEPITGLLLMPPAFHCGVLQHPRLEYGADTIDLTNARTESYQLRVGEGRVVSVGDGGPWLAAHWEPAIPADTPLVVRFGEQPAPELSYAWCLTMPQLHWLDSPPEGFDKELVRRLRTYRARAAASLDWQVFWCRADENFGGPRNRLQGLVPEPDAEGCSVAGRFAVGDDLDRLRLDFPECIGVTYTLPKFELVLEDTKVAIDLATVEMLAPHNVERRDGSFVVTGPDAYFGFALPKTLRVTAVAVAGVVR